MCVKQLAWHKHRCCPCCRRHNHRLRGRRCRSRARNSCSSFPICLVVVVRGPLSLQLKFMKRVPMPIQTMRPSCMNIHERHTVTKHPVYMIYVSYLARVKHVSFHVLQWKIYTNVNNFLKFLLSLSLNRFSLLFWISFALNGTQCDMCYAL